MKFVRGLLAFVAVMIATLGPVDAQRIAPHVQPRPGPTRVGPSVPLGHTDLGSSRGFSTDGGAGGSDEWSAPPLTAEERRANAEQRWAERNRHVLTYAEGVSIGAIAEDAPRLAAAVLDAPLSGRPALIVLLHPQADAPDIRRLGAAGAENVAVLDDPAHIERFLDRALSRFKGRPVLVVGHMRGYNRDAEIAVEDRDGEIAGSISSWLIQDRALSRKIWPLMLACESSEGGATLGTLTPLEPVQVATALPHIMAAQSYGDIFRALAATGIRFGVKADDFFASSPDLYAYNLDDFARDDYPHPVAILSVPPPDLPRLFDAAFPGACRDDAEGPDAGVRCDDIRELTSIWRFAPWVLGGFLGLFLGLGVVLWIISAITSFIDDLRYRFRRR